MDSLSCEMWGESYTANTPRIVRVCGADSFTFPVPRDRPFFFHSLGRRATMHKTNSRRLVSAVTTGTSRAISLGLGAIVLCPGSPRDPWI